MKSIIICLFLSFALFAQAQKGSKTFSASYGYGNGQIRPVIAMAKRSWSASEGGIKVLGLNYHTGIRKHSAFETGILILSHDYTYTNVDFRDVLIQTVTQKTYTSLIVPAKLKFDILKYFFISGGLLANINFNGEGHSIGVGIGAGVQYYHKNRYGLFVYPQANAHTLGIGLVESHIAFGISYRLQKN